MSDQPENLMLVDLRRIDQRTEALERSMANMGRRMTALKVGVAGVRRDIALVFETMSVGSQRADEADVRIDRIERRLVLIPEASGDA